MGECQETSLCAGNQVCKAEVGECQVSCVSSTGQCDTIVQLPNYTPCGASTVSKCWNGQCVSSVLPLQYAENATCVDRVSPWWDADSTAYTCVWYGSTPSMCDLYGDKYRNFGWTAAEACCGCGGGLKSISGASLPSARPSSSNPPKSGKKTSTCPPVKARKMCPTLGKIKCLSETSLCTWCSSANTCLAGKNSLAGCADPKAWLSACSQG